MSSTFFKRFFFPVMVIFLTSVQAPAARASFSEWVEKVKANFGPWRDAEYRRIKTDIQHLKTNGHESYKAMVIDRWREDIAQLKAMIDQMDEAALELLKQKASEKTKEWLTIAGAPVNIALKPVKDKLKESLDGWLEAMTAQLEKQSLQELEACLGAYEIALKKMGATMDAGMYSWIDKLFRWAVPVKKFLRLTSAMGNVGFAVAIIGKYPEHTPMTVRESLHHVLEIMGILGLGV